MTTLAELVAAPPVSTAGVVTDISLGSGTWRFALELADPGAGSSVVWHDITDWWTGHDLQLGADEYAGRYRAGVVTLELEVNDDRLAPWNDDTSPTFGTHVELDGGLLVRAGLIRVVDGAVAQWKPRFTMRVESWSDAARARGRIRQHTVVARDLMTDLVGVPVIADLEDNYYAQAQHVLTEAEWPYGSTIYGAQLTSGAADILTLPDVDDLDDASQALDRALDPAGILWYTNRKGQLIGRPQPGDTFHADAFTAGATGTPWSDPATVVFSYNAELDGRIAYAVDDSLPPFGIDGTELAVRNHVRVTHPGGVYDNDEPPSIQRFGRKSYKVSWAAANNAVADDILERRAYARKQATPLTTTIDLPGFFPAAADLEYLTPTRIDHQTAAGRAVVTGDGPIRQLFERMSPRAKSSTGVLSLNWEITATVDITATETADELNPVTGLAVTDLGYDDVTIGWSNPSQTITPTETWVRIPSISTLWIELGYPITAFTWLSLEPETTYTAEVRLVRRADGIITNVSPVRSVEFTTLEAPTADVDPDGDGGLIITLPDAGDGCVINWTLESSDDGINYTLVDSGTGDPFDVIDTDTLDNGLTYIVCVTEECGGVEGTTYCSYFIVPACSTPPGYTAGDPPYDDPDLILFVPETCPPDRVVEAISGVQAARGPAFGGFFSVDDDDIALAADTAAGGVIAFQTADALNYSGSATIGCRVSIQNGETVRLFSIAGLRLDCVDGTTGWYPRASVTTVYGDEVTITDPTERALITPFELRAAYDAETGELELLVDGTSVGTASVEEAAPRATGNLWYVGAPAASWITDCAVWSKVLTPVGGFDPTTLGWEHLYWAEGAEFVAEGYADTNQVDVWPDEAGTLDAVGGSVGRYAVSSIGGKPGVSMIGSGVGNRTAARPSNLTHPYTIVVVAQFTNIAGVKQAHDGRDASPRPGLVVSGGSFYGSAAISNSPANTSPHLFTVFYNSGSGVFEIDGVAQSATQSSGEQFEGLSIGTRYNNINQMVGAISFIGVYDGDVRSDPLWSDFEAWITSHYGISI